MDALKEQDPARIGGHTLLARLGAGGMGQVYLGRSPGGRLVAIKVIRDEIVDHPEALARFRREVATARAVRSAYTANLIDASLEAAPYWLATEYVAGPTLAAAVGERGAVPAETCRALFAALAEGLAAVHAHGVTHRDLKPQNVILAAQGPQLIDFGIARGVGQTALTETGFASGTPGFTAPEVLMRNQVGPEADIFALGATLAYAATGRPPFGHGDPAGVSYRAVHEPVDLVGVEPGLAALIQACVDKNPAARPGPAEVIARCAVGSALVEDGFYRSLAELGDAAPQVPSTPTTAAPGDLDLHDRPTAPGGPPGRQAPPPPPVGGYTPTQAAPTVAVVRQPRSPWLVAAAVVAAGAGTAGLLTFLPGDRDGDGKGTGAVESVAPGKTSAAPTDGKEGTSARRPPAYVEPTNPSRDYWTAEPDSSDYGQGSCNLPAEEPNRYLQTSISAADSDAPYTSGKARIGVRVKGFAAGAEEPYYVSVAVKPPHEIDPDTGRPIEGIPAQNLDLGYTSAPAELSSDWAYLTYPDDFRKFVNGKEAGRAVPVENDPGDWTVLFLHVTGTRRYASIDCRGFVSK